MPEATTEEIRSKFAKALGFVFGVALLLGWSGFLLVMYLVGIFWAPALYTALGLTAATVAGFFGWRFWRHSALVSDAKTSLAARAALDKLDLERTERDALERFDHGYVESLAILRDPLLDRGTKGLLAEADLQQVREHLYRTIKTLDRARNDLNDLRRHSQGSRSPELIAELEGDVKTLRRRIDRTADECQQVWQRLLRVRRAAQMRPDALEGNGSLQDVMADLDSAVAAFREIDEQEVVTAEAHSGRVRQIAQSSR